MNEEEKEKIFEISKRIGYKVGTYCNDEEIEVFEKFLEDYKYKNNLIKKQQAEIEKLRNNNKDLLRKLRNRVKEVKKLEKYSLYKKEFATLNKQLQKKDKIIDLMALDIYGMQMECNRYFKDIEEVRQYFERKIEQ